MEMPRISGYQFEKIIGKGAMSTVYLALQESLGRRVAIKVLSPGLAGDPIFSKRFIKEARIIGKLGHPHIVTIFDAGNLDDVYYIAMEYLEGGTLKERIKAGLTPDQAVTILCQIARALGRAHQQHCIHRDIKPANILFRNPDTALLSDFGIAKNTLDKTQLTAAGWRLGTPNYMSPEQALAKPTDARSDLYSLGVVFYEMLTGTRPFQGADAFDIALKHLKEPVPTLPVPLGRFQPALDRLLAKEPKSDSPAPRNCGGGPDAMAGKTAAISRPPERKAAVKSIRDVASVQVPASASPPWRRALPWILAGLLAGLAALLVYLVLARAVDRASSVMRPSD
ncbi:MAG: serine/threonine-protein kinase [Candidatus Competibacteraceae bacterium]